MYRLRSFDTSPWLLPLRRSRLLAMQHAGVNVLFMQGAPAVEKTLDTLLQGSGGNALTAAFALCERVRV